MCRWMIWGVVLAAHAAGAQTIPLMLRLGGSAADNAYAVVADRYGHTLVAGSTRSTDDTLSARPRLDLDGWVIKLDAYGQVLWHRTYGGTYNDEFKCVAALPDGGWLAAGETQSPQLTHGERDLWVVALNPLGELQWMRAYGGSGNDWLTSLVVLPDGSYVLGGQTGSTDGDLQGLLHRGGTDAWLVHCTISGSIMSQRRLGTPGNDWLTALIPAGGGQLLAALTTDGVGGDIPGPAKGKTDAALMRLGTNGNIAWVKRYGGSLHDEIKALSPSADAGFLAVGTTFSPDAGAQGYRQQGDLWALGLDGLGNVRWNRAYGGNGDDGADALTLLPGGEMMVVGTTRSRDGDIRTPKGVYDGWALKLTRTGALRWAMSLGGFENDGFRAVAALPNGDYCAVGYTSSRDGDLFCCPPLGGHDLWITHLRDPGATPTAVPTPVTYWAGYVRDSATSRLLAAELHLLDANGSLVQKLSTDPVTQLYRMPVTRPQGLQMVVYSQGYEPHTVPVVVFPGQEGTEVLKDLELKPLRVGLSFNLFNIAFAPASDKILPGSERELDRLAALLKANPGIYIDINGHTDNAGPPQGKMLLSLSRAYAVRQALADRSVPVTRMRPQGFGSDRPLVPEGTEQAYAQNRRVEVVITRIDPVPR